MTQEEKAKAYDEAIKRVESIKTGKCKTTFMFTEGLFEHIFPELKESEDERIRKAIIEFFELQDDHTTYSFIPKKDILAWLEKQGEQKQADKVEPKFHEGEWVVYECEEESATLQITRIVGETYVFSDDSTLGVVDEDTLRLWDITKDAKDGDVLWHSDSASNGIFIFKEIRHDGKVLCYCDYDSEDHFCLGEHHTCCWTNAKILRPATKEQCNLLFQKMKEDGYEWDAEKKELKKIEQKYWSEEDEEIYQSIMDDTVQENQLNDKQTNWLKSIKDRYIWKPSDEQLNNILDVLSFDNCTPKRRELLESLYNDLKKLKE